jgi:hypothetical protein
VQKQCRIWFVVGDKDQPSRWLEYACNFLKEERGDDSVFGMTLLGPGVGEVDIDGGDRCRRQVVGRKGHAFGESSDEVCQIIVFDFRPYLSGSVKTLFDGKPIDFWVFFCLLSDPRSITTAVFDMNLSRSGE